ncbi:MAG TPA: quinoprotein dehydrogenase-associated putative ABC transporter substrate-binding protein [Gemmatimonadales bacterium]|nr:quinoprotein dehydrogenase-associated putative ABC transporter substrate-binding protein [Gemmatimonadales bacterium]
MLLRAAASVGLLALLVTPAPAPAQQGGGLRSTLPTAGVLRICADPDNMPASNEKGEGYENKIAELLAKEWNAKLEYAWWPVRRGFFSRALNGRYCDIALTAPAELDMAATTKPYFRSAYVIVYRKDSGLDLQSLDDPDWKKLKIGVNLLNSDAENTPPAMALSRHGVVGNLVGFGTFYSELDRPEAIIDAVVDKKVDVSIVWGPLAGYFATRAPVPLVIRPIEYDSLADIPFAFNMSMAVRRRDGELRDSLQQVIDRKRPEIEAILREYHVPLLPVVEPKKAEEERTRAAPRGDAPAATGTGAPSSPPRQRSGNGV